MNDATVRDIVARVVGESPPIAGTMDGLAPEHRREVARLVRRDDLTEDAALAVIRGRRARQLEALTAPTEARAIAAQVRAAR